MSSVRIWIGDLILRQLGRLLLQVALISLAIGRTSGLLEVRVVALFGVSDVRSECRTGKGKKCS
jgi:hypothetical protein